MAKPVRYKRVSGFLAKAVNDEFIVFDVNRGRVYDLNPAAELIWKFLWKSRTVDELVDRLTEEFDIGRPAAKKDLLMLIKNFKDRLFLTE